MPTPLQMQGLTSAPLANVKADISNAPRALRQSDDLGNARRRFTREADRYLKQAENYTGALKDRYTSLAKESLNNALKTYSSKTPSSKYAKGIQNLSKKLGTELSPVKTNMGAKELISESMNALASASVDRRTVEAERIMSSSAGSRIYGATTNIWAKLGEEGRLTDKFSYRERNRALMDYFGVDDMMGVIEKFEEEFPDTLYGDADKIEKYDEVVTAGLAKFK